PDGAYDVALNLQEAIRKQGIIIENPATTSFLLSHSGVQIPIETNLLDRYTSPDLNQIGYWFNRNSINLYGEALLKTIAVEESQEPITEKIGHWEEKYWEAELGIQAGELRIRDGSGLSPETRVTTLAMVKIMSDAKTKPWFSGF